MESLESISVPTLVLVGEGDMPAIMSGTEFMQS